MTKKVPTLDGSNVLPVKFIPIFTDADSKGQVAVFTGTVWLILDVGTNGQVLSVNSSQPMGVEWADPTGGGDALPDGTAVGQIIAWDGTQWVNVPVGTDGQALLADSTAAAGLSWQAFGRQYRLWDTAGTYTFTRPAGVVQFDLFMIGAGTGGRGGAAYNSAAGSGTGSGGTAGAGASDGGFIHGLTLRGGSYSVAVGAGGAGGAGGTLVGNTLVASTSGSAGAASTFDGKSIAALITAYGDYVTASGLTSLVKVPFMPEGIPASGNMHAGATATTDSSDGGMTLSGSQGAAGGVQSGGALSIAQAGGAGGNVVVTSPNVTLSAGGAAVGTGGGGGQAVMSTVTAGRTAGKGGDGYFGGGGGGGGAVDASVPSTMVHGGAGGKGGDGLVLLSWRI